MKVQNMKSNKGKAVPNQFIITDDNSTCFQSYNRLIVKKSFENGKLSVYLDKNFWNYSRTTSKYRNEFLGESTKEIQDKINSGEYILTNLNK